MLRKFGAFFTLTLLLLGNPFALPVYAQQVQLADLDPGFDPNHILEDDDIFNVNGMSYSRMVDFLRSKGTLADTEMPDIDGKMKPVPDIVWRVATSYKINPKYLLALIQKEQSLVEDPSPTQKQFDWAAGYGVCDTCSMNDPAIQNFKGFASQLEWAAKQYREKYLFQILGFGATKAGKAAGKTMSVDGLTVTPVNNATAMLYSYTPHIHGNENLWRIWRRWFSLTYPDGTIVQAKTSGKTYMIRLGQKRPFASPAVVQSLVDDNKIIQVSDTELSAYPDGPEIKFPKYALLRDEEGHIWLLTGTARRQIQDMKAFHKFGFNEDEVEDVRDADLADYPVADRITTKTQFPQGVVMKEKETGTYWYVEDNVRQLIPAKVFLALYFQGRTIQSITAKKLAAYTKGPDYSLHDGELVRGVKAPSVYVVENGDLRPIPSADVFESVGWQWSNVVVVPDSVLKAYTVDDPFVPTAPSSTTQIASL